MELNATYDSMENVPEEFKEAYTELDDGSVRLNIKDGFKTEREVHGLTSALKKTREEKKDIAKKLKSVEGIDPTSYQETVSERDNLLKKVEELMAAQQTLKTNKPTEKEGKSMSEENSAEANKPSESNNEELIQKYVSEAVGKVREESEAKIDAMAKLLEESNKQAQDFQNRLKEKTFSDIITAAAKAHGVDDSNPHAMRLAQQFAREAGFTVDETGESVVARDGEGNPIFSGKNPENPLGLEEYFKDTFSTEYPFLIKKSRGAGASAGKQGATSTKAPKAEYIDDLKTPKQKVDYIKEHGSDALAELATRGKRPVTVAN